MFYINLEKQLYFMKGLEAENVHPSRRFLNNEWVNSLQSKAINFLYYNQKNKSEKSILIALNPKVAWQLNF